MSKKRILVLIVAVVVLAILAGRMLAAKETDKPTLAKDQTSAEERIFPVRTTQVESRLFERALRVQGNVEAQNYANVPARVFGPLDDVFVDEGDVVTKDETSLFQVDYANLERAVLVAEQKLAVARGEHRESQARLEQVEADFAKAELDFNRFQRLYQKDATTVDALEQQESRYKQALALRKLNAATVDVGAQKVREAELNVAIAEKNLNDSVVRAPVSGTITRRDAEPGEMAQPGVTIVRIEDLSTLEVSAFLPAEVYDDVRPAETPVHLLVSGRDAGQYTISWKSPVVHPKLRTFEVKCVLESPPDYVVPGAIAELGVSLESHQGLGVPRDAVQERAGQNIVFVVDQGRARLVAVEPGLTTDGWTEVRSDGLHAGDAVVSEGQYLLNDGVRVDAKGEGA